MAAGINQKLKLLYLAKILYEETDEDHGLTLSQIASKLEACEVHVERKTFYSDIEMLKVFGIDVLSEKRNRTVYYYVASREFELAELKLLVDAVQSSKFITLKKSNQLIKKLESLTSHYEATQLQREVYVSNRLKTINESIYYNVDQIHTAMGKNVQIRFQYYQWTLKKQMELKKNGDYYCISPWGLSWDDENYYMTGFDADAGQVKHYRVDKMLHIELTDIPREGQKHFDGLDMAQYARKMFGMFQGKEQLVRLECKNSMIGVILDRFGKDVQIIRKDEEHFTVNVNVVVSNQFFGWVIGLGDGVRITGPEMVVNRMKEIAGEMMKSYLNNGDN